MNFAKFKIFAEVENLILNFNQNDVKCFVKDYHFKTNGLNLLKSANFTLLTFLK